MNYLDACKEVRRESGTSGTGPSSVTNQAGILEKIVAWVNQAHMDVCNHQTEWNFLWRRKVAPLVPLKKDYTKAELGISDAGAIKQVSDTAGQPLAQVGWDYWKTTYDLDTATGPVKRYCVFPDGTVSFHPTPEVAVNVRFEYFTTPADLASNTDTFLVPAEYHRAIVWKALQYYAGEQEDAALMNRATKYLDEQMDGLARDYLPTIRM